MSRGYNPVAPVVHVFHVLSGFSKDKQGLPGTLSLESPRAVRL